MNVRGEDCFGGPYSGLIGHHYDPDTLQGVLPEGACAQCASDWGWYRDGPTCLKARERLRDMFRVATVREWLKPGGKLPGYGA